MKTLSGELSRRAIIFLAALLLVTLVCIQPVRSESDATNREPWGHCPRGQFTKVWSWGTDPDLGTSAELDTALKAERIKNATVEGSAGEVYTLAVTDGGYLLAKDRLRDCILRWNPRGELDLLLWSEATRQEIESSLLTGSTEESRALIEASPFSSVSTIRTRGELVYMLSSIGIGVSSPTAKKHIEPRLERPPRQFFLTITDRNGAIESVSRREARWYEDAYDFAIGPDGETVMHSKWRGTHIFCVYDTAGRLIRRVCAGRNEESVRFIDPDVPVNVEVKPIFPGVIPDRYKKDVEAAMEEERQTKEKKILDDRLAFADSIAGEIGEGSPPFEVYVDEALADTRRPMSMRTLGVTPDEDILFSYGGGRLLYFPQEGPPRVVKSPLPDISMIGQHYIGYRDGIFALYLRDAGEFQFFSESGRLLGKEPAPLVSERPTNLCIDASWNVFITTYNETSLPRDYTLWVYRPTEENLHALRDATR